MHQQYSATPAAAQLYTSLHTHKYAHACVCAAWLLVDFAYLHFTPRATTYRFSGGMHKGARLSPYIHKPTSHGIYEYGVESD